MPTALRSMTDLLPRLSSHYGRLPEMLPAHGPRRAKVALFLGCVADAVFPQTNLATARVLQHNGCDVWIPPTQKCCGALDYHSHHRHRAAQFAADNVRAFGFESGNAFRPDAIIVNAAGCGAMLKEYGVLFGQGSDGSAMKLFSASVKDVSEFLVDLGLVPPVNAVDMTATYHHACHLRHAQRIESQPLQLLRQVPGLRLVPLSESELCCGAAGSYNLEQPEMSNRLGQRKAERIAETGAQTVLTGNVGCIMQIAKHLRDRQPTPRVLHPVDVLWSAYSGKSP